MLEIIGLEKKYKKIKALSQISLQIQEGEIFGIVGQSGAGKTTLLKIIAGLLEADAGQILLDGEDLTQKNCYGSLDIGYVPCNYQLYKHLTVNEYLEFYAGLYQIDKKIQRQWILELLAMVGLSEAADIYVENLSQGMKQRLSVARALLPDPKVLVLDEPENGLEPKAKAELKETLKRLSDGKKSIIISSHTVSGMMDYCTSIGVLDKGMMILEGSMQEIMAEIKRKQPLVVHVLGMEEQAVSILKADSCVQKISLEQGRFTILFDGGEKEEAELLASLVEGRVPVQKFYRETGDLESRFLDLIS